MAPSPRWLLALLPCVLAACATTSGVEKPPPDLETECNAGKAWACESWGQRLAHEGQPEAAAVAYGRACVAGVVSGCIEEGRLRMAQGDLDGAERPLRRAYAEDSEEGANALADLQAARGHGEEAQRLRDEAFAMDKSDAEVVLAYRFGFNGDIGFSFDFNLQPMAFMARRLNLGLNIAAPASSIAELNGFVGYQFFFNSWVASYARLLAGTQLAGGSRFTVGAEAGMKLFGGRFGHLGVAIGSSNTSSLYTSVELGLDWVVALMIAAHAP